MGNKLQKLKQRSQIEEKSKPEELDSDFTCEICIEPIEANNKFNNNGLCKHNFCSDCIAKHVEEKVTGLKMANIDCPDLDCKFPLDPLSCRPILSKPVFDQWCELLCGETLLQKYELSQRCYCPYPDCAALVVNECNNKPRKSTCPSCKKSFCFQCQSPWHAGYRCGENHIEKSTNDILFGRLVEEQKWTRCPKCGHAVQRTTGCQVIFCRCGRMFCHACGQANHSGQSCKHIRNEMSTSFLFLVIIIGLIVGFLTGLVYLVRYIVHVIG